MFGHTKKAKNSLDMHHLFNKLIIWAVGMLEIEAIGL
jgi:hypothetical protein